MGFIYDFNKLYIPQNGAQHYYKVEVNEVIICRKPVSRGAKLELFITPELIENLLYHLALVAGNFLV